MTTGGAHNRVVHVERNTRGRDLLVGDVHGHFTKLRAALAAVGFDPEAGDRLFSVGDLVDRGPESEHVLDWLAQPWFHAVQGNHEDMAVRCAMGYIDRAIYMTNGGGWMLGKTPPERQQFADAFSALPLAIELETAEGLVGIVHADMPLKRWQDLAPRLATCTPFDLTALRDAIQWSRDRVDHVLDDVVEGVRAVVVGHTPMQRITSLGNVIFIDTGAWLPGRGGFQLLDAATLQPAKPRALAPAVPA